MQGVFAVFLVEEGYIQHAALVHSPYLHQRLSAADAGGRWGWAIMALQQAYSPSGRSRIG